MAEDRQQGDAQVHADADSHTPKNNREDSTVDSEQEHNEACKEKEHRNMK
jgi:hypothetical protein